MKSRPTSIHALVLIAATLVLIVAVLGVLVGSGWLHLPADRLVIDGIPIGEVANPGNCTGPGPYTCDDLAAAAEDALDARQPGHAPVIRATLHDPDYGNPALFPFGAPVMHGWQGVMVLTLSNGSQRAVGIFCGVGHCGVDVPTYPR